MLWWGQLGFTTCFPPIPAQPCNKHPAPACLSLCPAPSGYEMPLMEGQDGARGREGVAAGGARGPQGSLSPVLALPLQCRR